MKKLMLVCLLIGAVGCSNSPKNNEESPAIYIPDPEFAAKARSKTVVAEGLRIGRFAENTRFFVREDSACALLSELIWDDPDSATYRDVRDQNERIIKFFDVTDAGGKVQIIENEEIITTQTFSFE